MSRIIALDGLRGWFLITMTLSHLVLQQESWISKFHFRHFMFVESAQGFIFISGLLFGLVQYGRLQRFGRVTVLKSTFRRVFQLWFWTVALAFGLMWLRDVLPFGAEVFRNWLGVTTFTEPVRALALAMLVFQPTFLDILPQYILYLMVAPVILIMVQRDMWPVAAALTIVCWMSSQLGLMLPFSRGINSVFAATDGQGFRLAFDAMGWQLLFMTGIIFGALFRRGDLTAEALFPRHSAWPLAAAAVLLFFAPLRISTANGWLDSDTISVFVMMEKRADFGPVYVLNFVAACWLMGWLLYRGPHLVSSPLRGIAGLLHLMITLPAVVRLGRHSLLTYVWHVLLIYSLHYVDRVFGPLTGISITVAIALMFTLLFVPATCREWLAKRSDALPNGARQR